VIKSIRIRWQDRVKGMAEIHIKLWLENFKGRDHSLGRPRCRWEEGGMGLRKIGWGKCGLYTSGSGLEISGGLETG
jgi:hypothetical protein